MTTEEKLKHFLDTCMEDARARSSRMLDEYTAALQKSFEEHKQDARRRAQMQVRQETEKIGRELNKNFLPHSWSKSAPWDAGRKN